MIFLVTYLLASLSWGHEPINCFPGNDTRIPSFIEGTGVTKEQYQKTLERLALAYQQDFQQQNKTLQINNLWDADELRAFTSVEGIIAQVSVMGGLARHPRMTEDTLILVLCHEIGHHLGGSPRTVFQGLLVVEGQADYYATLKCSRRIFAQDDNRSYLVGNSPEKKECTNSFQAQDEVAICVRSIRAGVELAQLNAEVKKASLLPALFDADQNRVDELMVGHPRPQCRLDTYFAGAICPVSTSVDLSDFDLDVGTCSRWYGQSRGVRPLCWYDEKLNFTYGKTSL